MIPYFIQTATPSDDIQEDNIYTTPGFSEKDNMENEIITTITSYMYEFCSENDIKITSYDNFCKQFWELSEFQIRYWQQIFKVFYFENNEWLEWDILENADKIYDFYVNTYLL